MSDKPEYLQAASVKTLVEAIFTNWDFCHFHTDGTYLLGSTVGEPRGDVGSYSGRCFPRSRVQDEILRRFAALEAERDALKARLAEAERVMREALKYIKPVIDGNGPARTLLLNHIASAAPPAAQPAPEPQPPTAEGGTT